MGARTADATFARRTFRALGRMGLFLAIAVVVAEILLRAAAFFAHGRETAWRAGAERTILCVGDSHTYGALVSADESYPGQLQRLLDEREPGRWSVVNLGIPGTNTAQVTDQLRSGLAQYHPELVIVWCGVNNSWNRTAPGRSRETWRSRFERIAMRLRVYRLVRVWISDRSLNRLAGEIVATPGQRYDLVGQRDVFDPNDRTRTVVVREGRAEEIRFVFGQLDDAQVEQEAADDYQAMVDASRAAGARIGFIAYPIEKGAFETANRAARRVAERSGAPVVEAAEGVRRVPLEQRQLLWGAHPNGLMYAEIARDVVAVILDGGAPIRQPAPRSAGLFARLTFATEEGKRSGECPRETTGCAGATACYRWNPSGRAVCNVEQALGGPQPEVRASWRMRVTSPPQATGGTDVFSLIEKAYATGLRVEFADAEHLRVASFGSGGASASCGPLAAPIVANTWYAVRLRAKKGDAGTITLELSDDAGRAIDAVSCEAQPMGGGGFTHMVIGSGNTFGATADVLFGDVEVWGPAG